MTPQEWASTHHGIRMAAVTGNWESIDAYGTKVAAELAGEVQQPRDDGRVELDTEGDEG